MSKIIKKLKCYTKRYSIDRKEKERQHKRGTKINKI